MHALQHEKTVTPGLDFVMELTSCNIDAGEQMRYTTYGIRLLDEHGECILEYRDISTSQTFVEEFITLCTTHDVCAVHVADLLEDYLL